MKTFFNDSFLKESFNNMKLKVNKIPLKERQYCKLN